MKTFIPLTLKLFFIIALVLQTLIVVVLMEWFDSGTISLSVGIITSILIGYSLYQRIVPPLIELNKAIKSVTYGEWQPLLTLPFEVELKRLVESFNGMVEQSHVSFITLRESGNRLLKRFLEAMPLGIAVFDMDGQLYYINHKAQQLFGKRITKEIPTSQWAELCQLYVQNTQTFYPIERALIAKALKGESINVDNAEINRLNEVIPLEIWSTPVFDQRSKVAYAVLAFRDISKHKRAEMEKLSVAEEIVQLNRKLEHYLLSLEREVTEQTIILEEREQTLRAILNATTDSILMIETDGTIVTVNPTGAMCLKNSVTDVVGSCLYDFLPPEMAERERNLVEKVQRIKQSLVLETFNNNRWFENNFFPVIAEEGIVQRIVIFARDITARKQAEDALKLSQFSLDHAADGIQWLRSDGLHLYVNDAFCNLLHYTRDELLSMTATEVDVHLTTEMWETRWNEYKHRGSITFETEFCRKDGSVFPAETTASYFAFKEKEYLFTSVRNITERKEAEKALALANQAKSTFLTNMSHELRTPLNGILGFTQILQGDENLTTQQRESIAVIQQSGEHLLLLINDILDLAKIEAGKLELVLTEFHLAEFIKTVVGLFQLRARQKGLDFIYQELNRNTQESEGRQWGALPSAIKADEKRIRQVLFNLLGNAIKFTDHGSVTFLVGYQEGRLYFSVKDTGIGISEEEMTKIFFPFQRVGVKMHSVEGTGLGLPITKKLVEAMGGYLYVDSQLNQGSTFTFVLTVQSAFIPRVDLPPPQPKIIGFKTRYPTTPEKSFRILVVDDNRFNRLILINFLKPLGFEIVEAEDGTDALHKVYEHSPQAILMDLMMPGMNGFDCTRQIRKDATLQHVVVIALSASVFAQDRQRSIEVGCHAFLPKPIDRTQLLQTLAIHCQLEWVYNTTETGQGYMITNPLTLASFVVPATEQVELLLELIKLGDVQAILQTSQELKKDAQLQPFADEVQRLARSFKMRKLQEFVGKFVGK